MTQQFEIRCLYYIYKYHTSLEALEMALLVPLVTSHMLSTQVMSEEIKKEQSFIVMQPTLTIWS